MPVLMPYLDPSRVKVSRVTLSRYGALSHACEHAARLWAPFTRAARLCPLVVAFPQQYVPGCL